MTLISASPRCSESRESGLQPEILTHLKKIEVNVRRAADRAGTGGFY